MRLRKLVLPILLVAYGAPSALAQNAAAAPPLPASFYDVEVREELGFTSNDPIPSATAGVRIAGSSRAPANAPLNAQTRFVFNEFVGANRFIIAADSLLILNGPNRFDLAIRDIIAVEEYRRPARNQAIWVRVTYVARGEARQLFLRRTGTRNQQQILDSLAKAIEEERLARLQQQRGAER